ncbi:MAG: disulfide bond formation protein B [Candidatus Korarchaeum sp.]|nr:disulfide bond formation protein B [Candidatus Korarchaeum sp.]
MRLSYKDLMTLGILIALSGEIISFYTEYVLLVKPCLSCYILRYGYLTLILVQTISIFKRKIGIIATIIAILIVIISLYGLLGYMNYVANPCIETCPFGEDREVSFRLFSLSLIGGIAELVLMLLAMRSMRE